MKKLMSLIRDTIIYYKMPFLLGTCLYIIAICAGVFIFHGECIEIHPKSLEFLDLLAHNIFSVTLILVFGLISCGIFSNLILIVNGLVLGRVMVGVYNLYGIRPLLQHIAPHFIFETIGILIAVAISSESLKFIYNLNHKHPKVIHVRFAVIALGLMFFLLLLSAFIESRIGA